MWCTRPGAAVRWGRGVGALGGAAKGRRWCCSAERRRTKKLHQPAMVDPRRRRKREVRETMNEHGFVKRMARRCRGRRDLPLGGGGRCRNATVWPKKLAEEFAGNLTFPNFGVRSAAIGVAAHETGCTSEILASRATPAYIYIYAGFVDFGKSRYFSNY